MRKTRVRQYTIRSVPDRVDQELRRRAREQGKSVNQVALEALEAGTATGHRYHDLDFMIGTMDSTEAKRMEREVAKQRAIDPELWK